MLNSQFRFITSRNFESKQNMRSPLSVSLASFGLNLASAAVNEFFGPKICIAYILGVNGLNFIAFKCSWPYWWRSGALALTSALGVTFIRQETLPSAFGAYLIILSGFHFSEFLSTALFAPRNSLSTDSFLLNHSAAYHAAAIASWTEYFIEAYFMPTKAPLGIISISGIALCTMGEIIRKTAMAQAGTNFNHVVQSDRDPDHKLVTSGLFGLMRHPSYAGWFMWSVGTQVVLKNPFCFVAYGLASWRFFNERIEYEEWTLLNFFGSDYVNYKKRVPFSGVPFVTGYTNCDS